MDLDLTIRYSDNRLCEVVVCQPNDGRALYQINQAGAPALARRR
jgi:hypothetical protein